jgi:hypothetical protein
MAFAVRNLSVLAYANGFTLWHYKAGSATMAEAGEADFFTPASDLLNAGDILLLSAADGARVLAIGEAGRTAAMG